MKRRKEVERWLKKADDDLVVARRAMAGKKKILWAVCFHAQQSAEKDMKAFIIDRDVIPDRTHDLLNILEDCVQHDPEFTFLQSYCRILNPYSVQVRYPDEQEITTADARKALKAAEKIKEFVLERIR